MMAIETDLSTLLSYPFDAGAILRKKKVLRRFLVDAIEKAGARKELRIAILGGSTTNLLTEILELFLLNDGIRAQFYESAYNRYYEEVVFEPAKLMAFKPELIYVHTSNCNIRQFPRFSDSEEAITKSLEAELGHFKSLWTKINDSYGCPIIQNNFELPFQRSLGNLDFSNSRGRVNFIHRLNEGFARATSSNKQLKLLDINYLSSWFGLERWFDRRDWYCFKYAYSQDAAPLVAYNAFSITKSILGESKKGLVLDLDNTVWGGAIGDLGTNGIALGSEHPLGEAFVDFQQYIKTLKDRGVILAACSKNTKSNAEEGFTHPDSVLKRTDFASFQANWEPKPNNIGIIAQHLNIGQESLVFFDDSATEREFVRKSLPAVSVPETGEDVTQFITRLDKSGYFEPAQLVDEDLKKAIYYETNQKRESYKLTFSNEQDFLRSLEMVAEIKEFDGVYRDRIVQLVNKTNQFNFTLRRLSEKQLNDLMNEDPSYSFYARLKDRFGDNGLVSVLISKKIDPETVFIENWLMSCRVFKRNLELAVFDALVKKCKENAVNKITGEYIPSPNNTVVAAFYKDLGFKLIEQNESGSSKWEYLIPVNYRNKNKCIEVLN